MPSWAMTASESRLPLKEGCKSDKGLPQMTYVIDGVQYTLPSERYMERFETADGTTDCQYTVTELDIKQDGQENLFILGDQFMSEFTTVFDRDADEVCFGKAKHQGA